MEGALDSDNEGSPDLEKLLQTAESENLHLVKLIDTERQRHEAFQKQIEETIKHTEELEESTKNLDTKAKELHNKFKQNREICEGLKKTATVLDEHEEALRGKLSLVTLEEQSQTADNNKVIEKYEKMWERFLKKYESTPLAKELSEVKERAITTETSVKETSEKITTMKSQIVEMEIDKTHMQEYLHGDHGTAKDSIIKMAKLFSEAEKTSDNVREKLKELKRVQVELTSAREKQQQNVRERENVEKITNEKNSAQEGVSDESMEVLIEPQTDDDQGDGNTRVSTSNEINHHAVLVTTTVPQIQIPSTIQPANTTITTTSHTRGEQIKQAANQIFTYGQLSSRQQQQQSERRSNEMNEEQRGRKTQTQPQQRKALPLITTPLRSISNFQKERGQILTTPRQQISTQEVPQSNSQTPNTINMVHTAPQNQLPKNTIPSINQSGLYMPTVRVSQSGATTVTTTGQSESRRTINQSELRIPVSQSEFRQTINQSELLPTINQSELRMSQLGPSTPGRVSQSGQSIVTTAGQSGSRTPVIQSALRNLTISQSGLRTPIINQSESQAASTEAMSHIPVSQSQSSVGSHTPVHQSGSSSSITGSQSESGGTPVQGSPLDFSKHMRFMQSVSKSPGEGFTYRGRAMYNSNQVGEPAEEQESEDQDEPEVIYEAPLNDQHEMSLNFFQPFSQQVQPNAEPSPDRNKNMFMQSSPAKSGTSPDQAFSFGPGASSPNVLATNSYTTSSAGSIFGDSEGTTANTHHQEAESFNTAFSFFGAGRSPQKPTTSEKSPSGFSFSFGGGQESPARPNGNSGFSLF